MLKNTVANVKKKKRRSERGSKKKPDALKLKESVVNRNKTGRKEKRLNCGSVYLRRVLILLVT